MCDAWVDVVRFLSRRNWQLDKSLSVLLLPPKNAPQSRDDLFFNSYWGKDLLFFKTTVVDHGHDKTHDNLLVLRVVGVDV